MTKLPLLTALDHLVLTVADLPATVAFYQALGMRVEKFTPTGQAKEQGERLALCFGVQKINLHQSGKEISPNAQNASTGTADLCFLSPTPLADWMIHLRQAGIDVLQGPVPRTGAMAPIMSIYLRDPDGNLIEISNAA